MRLEFAKIILLFSPWVAGPVFADVPPSSGTIAPGSKLMIRVMRPDGSMEGTVSDGGLVTPLGSLYKLFQYAYLVEESYPEISYTCTGGNPEELFCGQPGETLGRETALARSCSPYFSAKRLGIERGPWRAFWSRHISDAPSWLLDLEKLKPDTRVKVRELLFALNGVRKNLQSFPEIEKGVMGALTFGTARAALPKWGSSLRVKTYTWRDEETRGEEKRADAGSVPLSDALGFTGGFAGWLPDGSAIWVSGAGHGRDAFLSELKDDIAPHMKPAGGECVEVSFFDRYPIRSVEPTSDPLQGKVKIVFQSGKELQISTDGTLRLDRGTDAIRIRGTFSIDEYIARVIDREVSPRPVEAARAFAIVARTFLLQNAKRTGSCYAISDSSHLQRVSPAPATPEALAIARWSDGLVLSGVESIRYHSTRSSWNRMSWVDARKLSENGLRMQEILGAYYPSGRISFGRPVSQRCEPDQVLASWIERQSRRWRVRLNAVPGFEKPERLAVCRLSAGVPAASVAANLQSGEIFVPRIRSQNDEISVIHEYLHIAFRNHPNGRNERWIENLARNLQEER